MSTVLVTGGANGIGLAIVRAFLSEGADVVVADLDVRALEALDGPRTVVADVATAEGAGKAVAAAGERVDVLVNNAGIADPILLVDELSDDLWARVLDVNLKAAYLLCARVLPGMVARGGGVIINNSSTAGLRGGRGGVAYTASKFALVGLTMNVAATFGAQGIRCNAICPGTIKTEIMTSFELSERAQRIRTRDRARPAPGTPEDVAAAAVFLASPAAERLNGVALPIDSGWIAY